MKTKKMCSMILTWVLLFLSLNCSSGQLLPCPIDLDGSPPDKNIFQLADYKKIVEEMCHDFNDSCGQQNCQLVFGLENYEYWALKMLDSSGKPPTGGIIVGDFNSLGHFTECVDIGYSHAVDSGHVNTSNIHDIKGKYVRLTLMQDPPNKDNNSTNSSHPQYFHDYPDFGFPFQIYDCNLQAERDIVKGLATILIQGGINLGVCVPSACTGAQVAQYITKQSPLMATKVFEYEKDVVTWFDASKNKEYTFKNDELSVMDIIAIIVLGIFISTAIAGTAIDVIAHQKEEVVIPSDLLSRVLLCFSVYTNGRKLLSTSSGPGSINCLNGLKFFSMTWVVFGHSWYVPGTLSPWTNSMDIAEIFDHWIYQTIFNGALAVDTFFLIGGFLFSFHFLNQLDKTDGKMNPLMVLMMYVHRYIRLTPVFAVSMLLMSTLLTHMAWGPLWDGMVNQGEHCAVSWWSNLLYINNYVNTDNICLGETWYLACDFQFYLLGPLLLYPVWRFRLGGVVWISFCLILSCFIPGIITFVNDYPPTSTLTVMPMDGTNWMNTFYKVAYTRASPWVLGLILGLVFNKIKLHETKVKMNKLVLVGMWSLSIVLCLAPLYGLESYWPYDVSCLPSPAGFRTCWTMWQAVSYTSLARLSWALGVAWVIFACATGNAGWVDAFLSWPPFTPLARLTYCCYLIHLHLLYYFFFSRKDVMYYDDYLVFYYFLATFVIANFFAFIFSLLFEAPFIGLEKIIFGRGGANRTNTKKQHKNNETTTDDVKNGIKNGKY